MYTPTTPICNKPPSVSRLRKQIFSTQTQPYLTLGYSISRKSTRSAVALTCFMDSYTSPVVVSLHPLEWGTTNATRLFVVWSLIDGYTCYFPLDTFQYPGFIQSPLSAFHVGVGVPDLIGEVLNLVFNVVAFPELRL